jgi:hypothetical protein
MPTETTGATPDTSTTTTPESATPPEGQQGQQQSSTGATPDQEQPQTSTTPTDGKPEKLPDDHPAAKALVAQKTEISTLKTELAEARAQAARTTKLEEDLGKRPTQEAVDTLQKRYDRLESFLQAVGGPLSKALDSRTFTRDLFESEKDIKDLVKEFSAANPTATSTALASAAAAPGAGKPDMNALLRSALPR